MPSASLSLPLRKSLSRDPHQEHNRALPNTLRKLIQRSLLRRYRRVTPLHAITLLLSTFIAVQVIGQTATTTTLRGKVSDAQGHAVGDAQLQLSFGNRTEVTATAVSNQLGQFEFAHLAPASVYRLRVTHPGFVTIEAAGISLQAGETMQLQVTLDPGRALSNAVTEIKGAAVREQVRTLPVRGQASGTLETLIPGAGATGGTFGSFPVNGSRAQFNTYIVSGTNNLDPFRNAEAIGQGGAFGAPAVLLPLDAIQEIEVQTNTGAEYGPSGAAVLTTIKSGGPHLHGSLFEFFDNEKLAANNFYNNAFGNPRPEFRNNQFGFTLGGPLSHRSYFFSSYEGQRERVGVTFASRFPTQGEIATATSLVLGTGRPVNALGAPILAQYPASLGQGPLSFSVIGSSDGNTVTFKGDHHNGQNNISASYVYGANRQSFPQGGFGLGAGSRLPSYASQSHTIVQLFAAQWQRALSSRLVNSARFGYSRYNETTFPGDTGFDVTTIGLNTGVNATRDSGLPEIDIAPGEYENLGAPLSLPRGRASNVYDFSDGLAWNRGVHHWKFGGGLTLLQENAFTDTGMRGRLVFDGSQLGDQLTTDFATASLVDLLAGLSAPSVTTISRGDSQRYVRQYRWSAFVEDGWQVRPALRVTLGLRHDEFSVPTEKEGRLSNFLPNAGLVLVGAGGLEHEYEPNHGDFAPRAAFSLGLGGSRILSGSWGIYFNARPFDEFMDNSSNSNSILAGPVFNPIGSSAIFTITPPAPVPFGPGIPIFGPATAQPPFDVFAVSTHLPDPRYQNFDLAFEQRIGAQQSLRVAYYGTRGSDLPVVIDINQPSPGSSDPVSEQARRPFGAAFPQFRVINTLSGIASSNYNSLQVSAQRSAANVTFRAAYTFSKSLDDASGAGGFYRGPAEDSRNLSRDYGRSDFDIRHRFTITYAWRIPAPGNVPGWVHALASNWQVNGITTLQSGGPLNITLPFDNSGTGEFRDRPNLVGNPHVPFDPLGPYLNPAAFAQPLPGTYGNLGRNAFSGPVLNDFDVSFVKSQQISGDCWLRFRAEFFNVWNHPNFANPSTTFGSGFRLTSTPDSFNPYFGNGGPRNVQLVAELEF